MSLETAVYPERLFTVLAFVILLLEMHRLDMSLESPIPRCLIIASVICALKTVEAIVAAFPELTIAFLGEEFL
jgi:hypothetical protein